MIHYFFTEANPVFLAGLSSLFALIITFCLLAFCAKSLPRDRGRAYASQADISVGKPTGAGLYFITATLISALIFLRVNTYVIILYSVIYLSMLFGFLDDRSKTPWHEYFKGILDLLVSFAAALTFMLYAGSEIYLPFTGHFIVLPEFVFLPLATLLVWVSINVTNCTDGVDGLASSLAIVSLTAFLGLTLILGTVSGWAYFISVSICALMAYLWFNTNPSRLLMGDAGSRGLGMILALGALFSRSPISYLVICLVFIVDGGAGIVKISLKRFLRISVLRNVKTPIHDHFRESGKADSDQKGKWKNQTLTIRFSMIGIFICSVYLFIEAICMNRI